MTPYLQWLLVHVNEPWQEVGQSLPCASLGYSYQVQTFQDYGPALGLE